MSREESEQGTQAAERQSFGELMQSKTFVVALVFVLGLAACLDHRGPRDQWPAGGRCEPVGDQLADGGWWGDAFWCWFGRRGR